MMNKLPLELLNINQLGERLTDIADSVDAYGVPNATMQNLRQIAEMLKTYKLGILVGSSLEEPAHVTAVATIETGYELAFWNWEAKEGYRQTDIAYRDRDIEDTLHGQATLDGNYEEDDEEEDD